MTHEEARELADRFFPGFTESPRFPSAVINIGRVIFAPKVYSEMKEARELADRFFPGLFAPKVYSEMSEGTTANSNSAAKEVVVQGAIKAIVDAVSTGVSLGRQGREDLGRAIERDTMNSSAGRAIGAPRQHGSFLRVQPYRDI